MENCCRAFSLSILTSILVDNMKNYKMQQILILQEQFHKWMQFPKKWQLTPTEQYDSFIFGQNPMEPGKDNFVGNVLLTIPEKIFKRSLAGKIF